jgi:APA family basic amino acid/polyamine antiporter
MCLANLQRGVHGEGVSNVQHLKRNLGLGQAVALGVSGTLGGGIFVLVGSAVGQAGPGALLAFLIAFAAASCIALPYAELAGRFPGAGGAYAATRAALGPWWGYLNGWVYLGAWVFASGFVTLGFGSYLQLLTGLPSVPAALGLIVLISALNLCAPRLASRMQLIAITAGAAALLAFAAFGAPHAVLHLQSLSPLLPNGLGGMLMAAPAAFLALNGFDTVAAAGEEVLRPERTLPRAIVLTLLVAVSLYVLVTLAALGALSWQVLGASNVPLADAATVTLGPTGAQLIATAALLTTATTANAALVVGSRVMFAMGRDGLLPRGLGGVHPRTGAPWLALLVTGAGLAAVAVCGSIALSAMVGGFLYALHYVLPLLGLMRVRLRRGPKPVFVTPAVWVVLPLALGGCGLLILASGAAGALGGVGWILLGLTVWLARWMARSYRAATRLRPIASATTASVGNAAPPSWASANAVSPRARRVSTSASS